MTNINMKEKEKEEFRSSGSRKEKEGTKVSVPTVHGATFNQTGCLSLTLFIFAYLYMLQQVYALATEWGSVPLKSFKRLHLEVGLDHQVNHNPVQLLNGNLESATVYNSSLPLKQRLRSLEKFDAKALGILVGINVSHSHYWYSENKFNREHAQVKGSFLPGTLPLSRTESLNRCYVDGKRYKYELMNANVCSYAPKYNLFFYMNPKCGSSSGKAIMKKYFGAGDQLFFKDCIDMFFNQTIYGHKGFKVTAVRHPYSRFYSGYEEVMFRKLTQKRFDRVPKDMRRFVHPYMNWTYPEYVDFGNTRKGMKQLANTLETFVEDFHNEKPFDNHLRTQGMCTTVGISSKCSLVRVAKILYHCDTKENFIALVSVLIILSH
uniref:Uncharacterized protein n=1 Tax=Aplanochytrium stocchinoi TaxID=215587 RepID=A0A7S3PQ01_9STRA|mmetsp:Transcript_33956/g.41875  ORF Transcript_33956/g.41875 Transcript_33956/m.41875 type:complete len:377 (-) Transcript_33956:1201-2331(-)